MMPKEVRIQGHLYRKVDEADLQHEQEDQMWGVYLAESSLPRPWPSRPGIPDDLLGEAQGRRGAEALLVGIVGMNLRRTTTLEDTWQRFVDVEMDDLYIVKPVDDREASMRVGEIRVAGRLYRLADTERATEMVKNRPDSFSYRGDLPLFETWALTPFIVHRDSDMGTKSNWEVISKDLEGRFSPDVEVVQTDHWAVGWMDHLAVRMLDESGAITPAGEAVLEWQDRLIEYPLADEDHYYDMRDDYIEDSSIETVKDVADVGEQEAEKIIGWIRQNAEDEWDQVQDDPENHQLDENVIMEAAKALGLVDAEEGDDSEDR